MLVVYLCSVVKHWGWYYVTTLDTREVSMSMTTVHSSRRYSMEHIAPGWRCGPRTWQQKPFTFSVFDNHSHSVFLGIFILSPTTYKILHLHSNTHMHQLWAGFCFLATFRWTRALLCCVLQTHMCRSEAKTQQKKVRWSGLPYGRRPIETVAYVCVCWYVPLTMTTESCEILAFVFPWLVSVSAVQS